MIVVNESRSPEVNKGGRRQWWLCVHVGKVAEREVVRSLLPMHEHSFWSLHQNVVRVHKTMGASGVAQITLTKQ
jgi:hypothetical protein